MFCRLCLLVISFKSCTLWCYDVLGKSIDVQVVHSCNNYGDRFTPFCASCIIQVAHLQNWPGNSGTSLKVLRSPGINLDWVQMKVLSPPTRPPSPAIHVLICSTSNMFMSSLFNFQFAFIWHIGFEISTFLRVANYVVTLLKISLWQPDIFLVVYMRQTPIDIASNCFIKLALQILQLALTDWDNSHFRAGSTPQLDKTNQLRRYMIAGNHLQKWLGCSNTRFVWS